MDAQAIDIDLDHTGQDDPDDGAGEPFDTDIASIPNLGAYRLIADDADVVREKCSVANFPSCGVSWYHDIRGHQDEPRKGVNQMAKRTRKPTAQVFIISWFPMYSKEASTMMSLSRERAEQSAESIRKSFEQWPDYNPQIHIDREERRLDF